MPTLTKTTLYRMEFTSLEIQNLVKQRVESERLEDLPLTARIRVDLLDRSGNASGTDSDNFILTLEWETD